MLKREGSEIAFVEIGFLAEAHSHLKEGGLDAALIDMTMPGGNGLDLVEEIHDGGVGRSIPALVLTANLASSVAIQAIEAGSRGALSKLASRPETVDSIKLLTDVRE